jgi:hypothetical protein
MEPVLRRLVCQCILIEAFCKRWCVSIFCLTRCAQTRPPRAGPPIMGRWDDPYGEFSMVHPRSGTTSRSLLTQSGRTTLS